MKAKKLIIFASCLLLLSAISLPANALCPDGTAGCESSVDGRGGSSGGTVSLTPPGGIGKDLTPQQFIGRIINSALGIVGSLALLMFIYGGFVWLTSAGSADKVTKGKNILVWATIGLVVIFTSYGATKFVLDRITTT